MIAGIYRDGAVPHRQARLHRGMWSFDKGRILGLRRFLSHSRLARDTAKRLAGHPGSGSQPVSLQSADGPAYC